MHELVAVRPYYHTKLVVTKSQQLLVRSHLCFGSGLGDGTNHQLKVPNQAGKIAAFKVSVHLGYSTEAPSPSTNPTSSHTHTHTHTDCWLSCATGDFQGEPPGLQAIPIITPAQSTFPFRLRRSPHQSCSERTVHQPARSSQSTCIRGSRRQIPTSKGLAYLGPRPKAQLCLRDGLD